MGKFGMNGSDDRNPLSQRGQQLFQTKRRQSGASTKTQHRGGLLGQAGKRDDTSNFRGRRSGYFAKVAKSQRDFGVRKLAAASFSSLALVNFYFVKEP